MKTAVTVFAYAAPSIETYAEECVTSIAAQTDQDFDLVVFNNGLATLDTLIGKSGVVATVVAASGSPASIRRDGIQHLINLGFDAIIFADIDDWFDANRVAVAKQLLCEDVDILVNELVLFGAGLAKPMPMLGGRLSEGEILSPELIQSGNCFGMSNTSVRVGAIPPSALIPADVVAFDWLFFGRLLDAGARARFTAATRTHYRQHANNTAAVGDLSDAQIMRSLQIKYEHYLALGNRLAAGFADTSRRLVNNPALADRYFHIIRTTAPKQPLWWESVKTLEELNL
jgi:glycosyltransferase involved in cell wall biosynthesis